MKKVLFILGVLLISSCATTHIGNIVSNAEINKGNFKYLKFAEGMSETSYIVGIGGFHAEGLFKEAKKAMYANANLKPNQIIANVSVDIQTTWIVFFVYINKKVIVSGDVIEFTKNELEENDANTDFFKSLNTNQNNFHQTNPSVEFKNTDFNNTNNNVVSKDLSTAKVGDKINFRDKNKNYSGIVEDITNDYITVKYYDNGKEKTKKLYK